MTEGMDPCERIWLALCAAEHYVVSVRGPFTIIRQEVITMTAHSLPSRVEIVEYCFIDQDTAEPSPSDPDVGSSSPSAAA
jgi:hypothetical protein